MSPDNNYQPAFESKPSCHHKRPLPAEQQGSSNNDTQSPGFPHLPPGLTSGVLLNRPRRGASPFWAGSRSYSGARESTTSSVAADRERSIRRPSSSLSLETQASPRSVSHSASFSSPQSAREKARYKRSPQLLSPAEAFPSPLSRVESPDSEKSLLESFASVPCPESPGEENTGTAFPEAPKRCVRPDGWWQRIRPQALKFGAPPVPERSPLRLLRSTQKSATEPPPLCVVHSAPHSAPVKKSSHCTPTSQSSESIEDRALWEELSPLPLYIRKTRRPAPLSSCHTSRSPELKQRYLCKHLDSDPRSAADQGTAVFEYPHSSGKLATEHRNEALEILVSSPDIHEQPSSKAKLEPKRRRVGRTFKMDSLHPDSAAAMTVHRREAVRLAEVQQRAVAEKCKRSKQSEPDYTFDELIGKGSFGRVYKGRQISSRKVVAIKVLDIDDADFHAYGDQKDEQIIEFNREIRILKQAQESGAENLNPMIEAMAVHSQLWLICEHCPGGSVKTLMRATNDRLAEKYLIVVARELAKALKGLHAAGIIHRDVKAANVLIHQEGRLQLCDFGVASVLDTRTDKRRTFIGTLHWMPPELWTENPEYSDEVDVWEYGCTLYECAIGHPPNSDLRERQQLKMRMRRLKQPLSLPEKETFSDGLRALVSYALSPDVATRPSMVDILNYDVLKDTDETHPTSSLTELVQTYYEWLFGGGQRVSLFMPGGAAAASTEDPDKHIEEIDEWNFGITQDFERRVSAILEIPDFDVASPSDTMEGEETPKGASRPGGVSPPMTQAQIANFEARVRRGADLSNLFDQSAPAYEYKTKTDFVPVPEQRRISDLPFRAMAEDRPSSIASNVIDLGDFDEADYAVVAAPKTDDKIQTTYAAPTRGETIRLADASTLRDKRANSKGPRDPHNQSLTARRTSSVEDIPAGISAHDFATSQEDWTVKNRTKAPELQEPAEITSSRPGHATMDWSFASAMSQVAPSSVPEISTSEPSPVQIDDPSGPTETTEFEQKAKKHATMDWSFTSAMAEAKATDDEEPEEPTPSSSTTIIDSSPPTSRLQNTQPSRPTPTRPALLMRQMTMPVTIDDYAQVEEQDIPRPSTALSEAYSDISTSSTDVDPFGLEREDDDYPGPATMEDDVGSGMSSFYSGRGRTMLGETAKRSYGSPSATTPLTASGPAPYALGRPARIGEEGFPGQSFRSGAVQANTKTSYAADSPLSSQPLPSATTSHRNVVEVPGASPPNIAALSDGASSEAIEAELTRMLEEMQGTLNAARSVVGGLERGRRRERESDEWEDEE